MRVVTVLPVLFCLFAASACSKAGNEKAHPAATAAPVVGTIEGRRIDIKVSEMGYEPNKLPVKAHERVTLVFTRTAEGECIEKVQIPSKNILKPLPLNQPVAIPFESDKPGDVKFACGMDMQKGTIIVAP